MKKRYDVILRIFNNDGSTAVEQPFGNFVASDGIISEVSSSLYGSLRPGESIVDAQRKLPEPYYSIKAVTGQHAI
jgi:hypothetical protein